MCSNYDLAAEVMAKYIKNNRTWHSNTEGKHYIQYMNEGVQIRKEWDKNAYVTATFTRIQTQTLT